MKKSGAHVFDLQTRKHLRNASEDTKYTGTLGREVQAQYVVLLHLPK